MAQRALDLLLDKPCEIGGRIVNKKILAKLQNIPEGQPNVNGRVYTKEVIDSMVLATAEEPVLVRIGQMKPNERDDVRLTVGRAKVVRKDDGPYIEVTLAGRPGLEIEELLKNGKLVAVTDGMGKVSIGPGGVTVVDDFTLNRISLITPERAGLAYEQISDEAEDE